TAQHLLVYAHVLEHGGRRYRGDPRGEAGPLHQPPYPFGFIARHEPAFARHGSRHRQARTDRLAMQPLLISGGGFDRVTEGMPQIQQRALARLALVAATAVGYSDTGLSASTTYAYRVR